MWGFSFTAKLVTGAYTDPATIDVQAQVPALISLTYSHKPHVQEGANTKLLGWTIRKVGKLGYDGGGGQRVAKNQECGLWFFPNWNVDIE